jgi:lipopolysaccharide export LptBFGC system permease protein LptF
LKDVIINKFEDGISSQIYLDKYSIISKYNYHKISVLFKNFDTMSFLELLLNYDDLQKKGYNKSYLDQNLNSMLSMPFFLFIMTSLASILTMNALKKSNNFAFIVVGLIACVAIYYFKDLSLALGQTNRISLSLSVWIPVITIGLFSSIGVLHINEK